MRQKEGAWMGHGLLCAGEQCNRRSPSTLLRAGFRLTALAQDDSICGDVERIPVLRIETLGTHFIPSEKCKPRGLEHLLTPDSYGAAEAAPLQGAYLYPRRKSLAFWMITSRLTSEMASVNGICFGQVSTQFWAKPHSWMPPSPARARRRSSLKTLPVGWLLKSLTWAMVAAPTKPVSSLNCGQTSMQQQQEMQLESG